MQTVGFKVTSIKKAIKANHVVVGVRFDNESHKIYEYVRKDNGGNTIIDGCKISYNHNFEFTSVERIYETKGVKHADTSNIGKKTSGKIKDEIIKNNIKIPEVAKEIIPQVTGEVHHEMYEEIKTCIECNIPIYLAGPAGSGKNHTVEQIANELDMNFFFANAIQQEYKLTGFIDAGGVFHETEFYKACTDEKECIFFLDEMDASIPEVLVLLNAAIANGYFEFPTGKVELNNVRFVSAGNTVGSGADDMYTGRMVLDQATLDRFAIIEFNYSLRIEMSITKNNVELVEFIRQLRKEAEQKGIRATFSYRCMTMITKLEKAGMDLEMAIKISVIKGLDKDTINTLHPQGTTKYHVALNKIQRAA